MKGDSDKMTQTGVKQTRWQNQVFKKSANVVSVDEFLPKLRRVVELDSRVPPAPMCLHVELRLSTLAPILIHVSAHSTRACYAI